MNTVHNPRRTTTVPSQTASSFHPLPMHHSQPIEVDGVFLGAAIEHELGVRFIAVDVRVTEMDQSIWPNVDYAHRSARQLFKSARGEAGFA